MCGAFAEWRLQGGNAGVEMRRVLIVFLLFAVVLAGQAFADTTNLSSVTIASIVQGQMDINPSIMIGVGSAELSYLMTPDKETATIGNLNLMDDGYFTFALMTSDDVRIISENYKYSIEIEIRTEGFHLFDYSTAGMLEGSSMDEAMIKRRNAVPLVTDRPEILIPGFHGQDENVAVSHIGKEDNKINVTFKPGLTKAELVLGTFDVSWKGQKPLEPGVYKARVSLVYSTQ